MNYETLSPSQCAQEILDQILAIENPALSRRKLESLIRQKVRHVIEHCAMIAEDYAATHDLHEPNVHLWEKGMAIGDEIGEQIRQLAEERNEDSFRNVAPMTENVETQIHRSHIGATDC
jgi:hypothetical protein